jgi:hypothetical protein
VKEKEASDKAVTEGKASEEGKVQEVQGEQVKNTGEKKKEHKDVQEANTEGN